MKNKNKRPDEKASCHWPIHYFHTRAKVNYPSDTFSKNPEDDFIKGEYLFVHFPSTKKKRT